MTVLAGVCCAGSRAMLEDHCRHALAAQRRFTAAGKDHIRIFETVALAVGGTKLAQPSRLTNPALCLGADIRIDNRDELARMLGFRDEELVGLSDADLLLAAWTCRGPGSLDVLIGSFAFAVHDAARRLTFLVRDPMGERPLSYSTRHGCLSFASMPSGIWPGTRLTPDLAALARTLRDERLPPEQSLYQGVTRVAPGTMVEFDGNRIRKHRYWRPKQVALPRKHGDLIEAFRETMDLAVKSRLSGPGSPAATTLSSGFDSSAVTGTAARLLDSPALLTAYTSAPARTDCLLLPHGRFADETCIAAKTAAMLGIGHRTVRDTSSILSQLRGLASFFQAPAPNPFNLGWMRMILDEVRAAGQSRILIATEGNVTISYGGLQALPAFVSSGRWPTWLHELRSLVRRHPHLRWRGALFASLEHFLPTPAVTALNAAFGRTNADPNLEFLSPQFRTMQPLPEVRFPGDLFRDRLASLALHDNGDRLKGMAALTGVEELDPTADRRLIEFCLSLKPQHLLSDGEPRPLAREAFSDRMDASVFDTRMRGYQSADWYARLHERDLRATLAEIRSTSASELLDIPKLERMTGRWPPYDAHNQVPLFQFARRVSQAVNAGLFVSEIERAMDRTAYRPSIVGVQQLDPVTP